MRFTRLYATLVCATLVCEALANPAGASVVMIYPTFARSVQDVPRDGVFDRFDGGLGSLDTSNLVTGDMSPRENRSIEEFSLTSLASFTSAQIQSATLYYYANLTELASVIGEVPPNIEVHGYVGNGFEDLSDAEINNLLGTSGAIVTAPVQLTFDVTNFIKNLVTIGDSFAGFQFRTSVDQSLVVAMLGVGNHRLVVQVGDAVAPVSPVIPIAAIVSAPEPGAWLVWGLLAACGLLVEKVMPRNITAAAPAFARAARA